MLLDISRPSRQEHELFQAEVRELRSEVTRLKTMLSVGGTAAAIILSVAIFVANQQLNALDQNFRFGTPTRTWYSLSSPEGNDFAS